MKLINDRSNDESLRTNRKVEAEILRGMRMQNTHRSIAFFGGFAVSTLGILVVLLLPLLLGFGIITLSDKAVIAFLLAIAAARRAMFTNIIKSLFSKTE
jgi:hypothetical protein